MLGEAGALKRKKMLELPIKISSVMVSVGTRVLRESGLLFGESSADSLVVLRILETGLAAHKAPRKRCKSESSDLVRIEFLTMSLRWCGAATTQALERCPKELSEMSPDARANARQAPSWLTDILFFPL